MISRQFRRTRSAGFTLIELMVVVAIVAILAIIAVPSYSAYVQRSRIVDATTGLADYRVRMEQYFLDNRKYNGAGTSCGIPPPPDTSFHFDCKADDPTHYTVTATGQAAKNMKDFVYTIDQSNVKTSAGPTGWTSSTSCWVTRKDGSCG